MGRVAGKVALITGAASGIGKATAELLIQEGAHVILTDIQEDLGQKIADDLGDQAFFYTLDVSHENQWHIISEEIKKRFGHLDILVNNAGIIGLGGEFGPQDPEHMSLKDWRTIQETNMESCFLGCKYAIQLMKANPNGGSIINMSSRSGLVGIPTACGYAASKAAMRNHTKSVALYCAEQGYKIRCNSIHPAAIMTPLWDPMLGEGEGRQAAVEAICAGIPMGHMGEPLDVANAVLYLASDESKYLTGVELTIDGGILAGCAATPKAKGE